ncbi:MAG: integrase catalytic subunit [Candidatus Dadabacteria bacterium CSP1-2]|nr:MAG: integrase catalytic subunit [Candidatus Dadabacteria bacterium CSP1-2]
MEVITLRRQELTRYQVINGTIERKISNTEAAILLGISKRQVIRVKNKIRRVDFNGVVHGNRGRRPKLGISNETKEMILSLYQNRYYGFNVTHFGEFLKEVHGIQVSRETLRKLLLISGLRTKSKSPPRHRTRRARMPRSGLLVQMDSSEHKWLEESTIWLIATIDDATGEVPYALFVDSDSTENNMRVIKRLIEKRGMPVALYTDGASHFITQRHYSYRVNLRYDDTPTQIQRALNELGVRLIIAGSPQAKGRVERLFETFQDRLLKELKLYKISSIEKANRYLHNKFLPRFNNKFSNAPKDPETAWRVLPKELNLESVFSIKEQRTVMADNTISFRNRIFQILPDKYRISFAKAKVVVEKRLDGSIHIRYKDQYLNFKEISSDEIKKIKTNTLPLEKLLTGDIFTLHQG